MQHKISLKVVFFMKVSSRAKYRRGRSEETDDIWGSRPEELELVKNEI